MEPIGPDILLIVILVLFIGVWIFYFYNLQETMKSIDYTNRQLPPGRVWLMLIPLFGLGYAFYYYQKLSESIRLQSIANEELETGDYLKGLGLAISIVGIVCLITRRNDDIQDLASLAYLVLMIIMWVKTAQYKRRFLNRASGSGISNREDLLD